MSKFHSYVAEADPASRELLTRLLEWQTNTFGRRVTESTGDLYFKYDPERAARSIYPSSSWDSRPGLFALFPSHPCRNSRRSFNAVVAYEDVTAAKRAKEVCDRLRCSLGDEVVFEMHLWRFDVMRTAGLIDTAVKDAVQARLIILATRGLKDLPADLKAWIEFWIAQRRARPGALVLLVDPVAPSSGLRTTPQFVYLESVAQRARMAFFASISNTPKTTEQKL
jgi:hypothetical protein